MSGPTHGQRIRLGIFMALALSVLGGTLLVLIGSAILEERDAYFIDFEGSISGLDVGSSISYNGVRVGRVERIRLSPDEVEKIRVHVTLDKGTRIKADVAATLEMQGITGLKSIELSGGTDKAKDHDPKLPIPTKAGGFASLMDNADKIANDIRKVVSNLVDMTGGETQADIKQTVAAVRSTVVTIDTVLKDNRDGVKRLITSAAGLTEDLRQLKDSVKTTLSNFDQSVTKVSDWVKPYQVSAFLTQATGTLSTVKARMGKEELGKTMTSLEKLASRTTLMIEHVDLALLQIKDEFLSVLEQLIEGAENFSEFAGVLKNNPSALITGRTDKARQLP